MIPASFDLTGDSAIYQGDDYELSFRVRTLNSDGTYGGYIDLTSYTNLKAQIRATAGNQQAMAEFTCTKGNQTTTPGLVTLSLAASVTAGLTAGNGVWDFEMVGSDSKKHTYLAGSVLITAEVTRA